MILYIYINIYIYIYTYVYIIIYINIYNISYTETNRTKNCNHQVPEIFNMHLDMTKKVW